VSSDTRMTRDSRNMCSHTRVRSSIGSFGKRVNSNTLSSIGVSGRASMEQSDLVACFKGSST